MRSRLLTALVGGVLLYTCLLAGGTAGSAPAEGPRPGIPRHTESGGKWIAVPQSGVAETKRLKQWARVPLQATAAYTINKELRTPDDPRFRYFESRNKLYLIAEADAPHSYGLSAPFTVHSVAFGAIPVTATLRLAQRRTDEDLPIPFDVVTYDEGWPAALKPDGWVTPHRYYDAPLEDEIDLVIEELRVDGVDLRLRPGCRTATRAKLDLTGKGWFRGDPDDAVDEDDPGASGHYVAGAGGVMTGTIDIPAFGSCLAADGENLSPLLTATVSGSDNAVVLSVGKPACALPPLGSYEPDEYCTEESLPKTNLSLPPRQF